MLSNKRTLGFFFYLYRSVCQHLNVPTLTSHPVLKLLASQGYLWLPYKAMLSYDVVEVIKLIGEIFEPKTFFKKYFGIPSALLSFLPYYCHTIRISVIPSKFVIPSKLLSFQIFVILNSSCTIPEGRENWPAEPAIFASS